LVVGWGVWLEQGLEGVGWCGGTRVCGIGGWSARARGGGVWRVWWGRR